MKHLILHIGMGKCGSTAIQTMLNATEEASIEYICYPGEIDANPIISSYVGSKDKIPESINHVLRRNQLLEPFSEYAQKRIQASDSQYVIISSEHISWLVDDEGSNRLAEEFLLPLSQHRKITVVAYFRKPATSRYLSTLQEDAKYNGSIKLYVPDWPYSENHIVHRRWSKICESYGFEWVPVAFNIDILGRSDVRADFVMRTGLPIEVKGLPSRENASVDPILLCAYRNIVGSCLDKLEWDRKSKLLAKLITCWHKIKPLNSKELEATWKFKKEINDYILDVSHIEDRDSYVNAIPEMNLSSPEITNNWDPLRLKSILPDGLMHTNGYLTGPLHLFLDGIDLESVELIESILKTEVLKFFSLYFDKI